MLRFAVTRTEASGINAVGWQREPYVNSKGGWYYRAANANEHVAIMGRITRDKRGIECGRAEAARALWAEG